MTAMEPPFRPDQVTIVPANEVSCDELTAVFGTDKD